MADSGPTIYRCADCNVFFYTLPAFEGHECAGQNDTSTCENSATSSVWDVPKTKELLSKYKEMKSKFQNPAIKNKKLWEEITNFLNATTSSSFLPVQVEGRWKTVLASYRRYKDNQKKTGEAKKSYEYEREMDEIMGESHSTSPTFLFSSSTSASAVNTSSSNSIESDSDTPLDEVEGTSKRKSNPEKKTVKKRKSVSGPSMVVSFLEKYTESVDESRKRQEERHKEQMSLLKDMTSAITKLAEKK